MQKMDLDQYFPNNRAEQANLITFYNFTLWCPVSSVMNPKRNGFDVVINHSIVLHPRRMHREATSTTDFLLIQQQVGLFA